MLGALTRQSLKGLTRAPLSQLITVSLIAVSASLMAVSLTLVMNLDRLSQRWGEEGELLVVLSPSLTPERYLLLKGHTEALEGVKEVRLRTPEDAQAELREVLGAQERELEGALTALPGTLELRLLDPSDAQALSALRAQLLDLEGVVELASVTDGGGLLAQLYAFRQGLKAWLWVIGLWVGLSVAFVITQLVRLTLFQRQRELDIWISVGANELLIVGPLMIESATQTGLGAWVALELVNQGLSYLTLRGESTLKLLDLELTPLPPWGQALFLGCAMLLGALASLRVARASLRVKS